MIDSIIASIKNQLNFKFGIQCEYVSFFLVRYFVFCRSFIWNEIYLFKIFAQHTEEYFK